MQHKHSPDERAAGLGGPEGGEAEAALGGHDGPAAAGAGGRVARGGRGHAQGRGGCDSHVVIKKEHLRGEAQGRAYEGGARRRRQCPAAAEWGGNAAATNAVARRAKQAQEGSAPRWCQS